MSRTALGLSIGLAASRAPSVGSEPEEFITNGGFATDTDWVKGVGWTISAGVAAQDGSSPTGALSQNFAALVQPLVSGNSYVLSFDLTNALSGTVTATLSGGTGAQVVYSDTGAGAISIPFTATSDRTSIAFRSPDEAAIAVDNVSLVPAP